MKLRYGMMMMTAALLATLGCSSKMTPATEPEASPEQGKIAVAPASVLVAYYSWGGNTRHVAEQIQKATGGDLFEIKPVTPYPEDYRACVDQAGVEIKAGARPELASKPESLDAYQVIFVGSPNWWGTIAPPVTTFLAAYDWSGKKVIPFFTHGGGGLQNCEKDVRALTLVGTTLPCKAMPGSQVKSLDGDVAAWVASMLDLQ